MVLQTLFVGLGKSQSGQHIGARGELILLCCCLLACPALSVMLCAGRIGAGCGELPAEFGLMVLGTRG